MAWQWQGNEAIRCGGEFDNDQTRSFTVLAAGIIISHYKIISKIDAGGTGKVWVKFKYPH